MEKKMNLFKLIITLTGMLIALSAQAHTVLSSSIPAKDAIETSPPGEITLVFSTKVRITGLSVENSSGDPITLDALPSEMQQEFIIATPNIQMGNYVVKWRAIGADMHVVSGEFEFVVAELASKE
ncbi:MAG: hypothetical protein CMM56_06085 [Rhodospirillaceae bacterium]|nr:hypothetical protein [Rhodospirillaceae bacterium]|tara:strand:- start:1102 stop:1476 length:375 start_codon:yes stop_codon:yes gene_type:complete